MLLNAAARRWCWGFVRPLRCYPRVPARGVTTTSICEPFALESNVEPDPCR
jgi:hypothetical protein